jgi:Mg-chelatase subunit ChlD
LSEPVDRSILRARIDVVSSKAAAAFDDAVDAVAPLLTPEDLTTWVDLGGAIAAGSAVTAVKYFRESPSRLAPLPRERRPAVVRIARAVARIQPNVALELFRYAVPLAERLDDTNLTEWGRIGSAIADQDYDAAIEFVHESAALAGLIPTDAFSLWGEIGMALSKEDRAVKDFSSLTYFRSSAEWLGAIADPPLRPLALTLGYKIVAAEFPSGAPRRPGQVALDVLRYAPTLLGSLPSDQTRHALLTSGIRVAERAPGLVGVFLRHAPEVIRLVEGSVTRFDEWVSEGLAIAGSHRERAEAYFSLRSKQGVEVAQRLSKGIFLRDIKPTLTYVAEAMCGRAVEIRPGAGASSALTARGGTITLPERITAYPTSEENLRFYRVLTYHEAAHLEFGTYEPVSPDVAGWFGVGSHDADGAASLMRRFPDPQLAQNLWTIAEEARIDFLLRHHYPGLRADMDRVLFEQLRMRPKMETLGRRESILESILQLSVADTAEVPLPVLEPVTQAYDVIKRLRDPGATVRDVLRTVVDLYPLVADRLETAGHAPEQSEPPVEPRSEFDQLAMGHAPIGSFAFRDALQAPQLAMGQRGGQRSAAPPDTSRQFEAVEPPAAEAARPSSPLGDHVTVGSPLSDAGFWYDEWDHAALEYKPRWCRVEQLPAASGGDDEAAALLAETRGVEASLRRYFAVIRPEAFRKAMRQPDGEEIDLDAAIAAAADRRARMTPSDRLYIRREKRVRDVAVAVLVDASGSTGRQISGPGRSRRVIDVARESLALLGSALDALGDQFGLYAFSGQSRQGVNCRVVKAFDEPFGPTSLARISGLAPSGQNRDGAAIRHVTRRLQNRDAAVKLLIVLSDGRPLDDDYAGDYALEDTRAALRECRAAGVQPFCVTVDDAADRYIERLYGEVRYTVIPDVTALPERLPRLYKRLTT